MEVSYGEGLATRTGPESCAGSREGPGEALTGVPVGRVSSRENDCHFRGADALGTAEGNTSGVVMARPERAPRGRRPRAHWRNSSHGNREIPWLPQRRGCGGRAGKSEDATQR